MRDLILTFILEGASLERFISPKGVLRATTFPKRFVIRTMEFPVLLLMLFTVSTSSEGATVDYGKRLEDQRTILRSRLEARHRVPEALLGRRQPQDEILPHQEEFYFPQTTEDCYNSRLLDKMPLAKALPSSESGERRICLGVFLSSSLLCSPTPPQSRWGPQPTCACACSSIKRSTQWRTSSRRYRPYHPRRGCRRTSTTKVATRL